ncbi:uncharacterized protein MYCGRDRAFT_97712 [Zymoseptoria tritici IPO323]|uniref:Uncharacterized protein n=1 Tax=Zymoseptoria tritici (strain CBS 115943 / IPO323) TaxID=336722 RepID=F9XR50_ZYMTI|nr:uncharacterized protein MYCGRDRAFT_97712 [Zymoseptoria tritici IPO323]EGP82273.1 hypothetical protein MYCGRDRAFT_97712 [Zymoseptoria tritici IPO323]
MIKDLRLCAGEVNWQFCRIDGSSGCSLRIFRMEQATDHAGRDSALIGGSGLLLIAHEVLFLCSASLDIVDDHGGYEVTLPASTDITGQTSPDSALVSSCLSFLRPHSCVVGTRRFLRVIEFPEVILPAINDTGRD